MEVGVTDNKIVKTCEASAELWQHVRLKVKWQLEHTGQTSYW